MSLSKMAGRGLRQLSQLSHPRSANFSHTALFASSAFQTREILTRTASTMHSSTRPFSSSAAAQVNQSGQAPQLKETVAPADFFQILRENNLGDLFTGVPDSLLKDFCAYVTDHFGNLQTAGAAVPDPKDLHVISANEGTAVGAACGFHLGSGGKTVPVVYLQNSGYGNIINPLLSLVDIYEIPVLFLVGWRGEPGVKDEPQHRLMGDLQTGLLDAVNLPYSILRPGEEDPRVTVQKALPTLKQNKPYCILVPKGVFEKYKMTGSSDSAATPTPAPQSPPQLHTFSKPVDSLLTREEAISTILPHITKSKENPDAKNIPVIGTTGFPGRELYESRVRLEHQLGHDFLCVGSMGHAGAIAQGVALGLEHAKSAGKGSADGDRDTVICLDGDGAALMHMGQMALTGEIDLMAMAQHGAALMHLGQMALTGQHRSRHSKIIHILVNNGLHESVGGQPTLGFNISFQEIARGCGYHTIAGAETPEEISREVKRCIDASVKDGGNSAHFLEIRVKPGSRKDLGRPKSTPVENKTAFLKVNFE